MSASHADDLVKAVMERCISENYVDKHITNLKVCETALYFIYTVGQKQGDILLWFISSSKY